MLCYAYVAREDEAKPGSTCTVDASGSSKMMTFFKLQSCLHPTPPTIRTSFELQCAIARSTEKKESSISTYVS